MNESLRRQATLERLQRIHGGEKERVGKVMTTLLVHIGDNDITAATNAALARAAAGPRDD